MLNLIVYDVSCIGYIQLNYKMIVNDEFEGTWKEAVMSNFMHFMYYILFIYCPGILCGVTKENSEKSELIWSFAEIWNCGYKTTTLLCWYKVELLFLSKMWYNLLKFLVF